LDGQAAADVVEQQAKAAAEEGLEPEEADTEDEEDALDPVKLAQMKAASRGADVQNAFAAQQARNNTLAKYAHGSIRSSLEEHRHTVKDIGSGAHGKRRADRSAAIVSEPGAALGEEVLLFEPKDLAAAKYSYTIKAEQDCSFYVADFTTWRQLCTFIAQENIASCVHEQLHRRSTQVARTKVVSKRLDRRKRKVQQSEHHKEDRQRLHLPQSGGSHGPAEMEDTDNYLQTVFDHRRWPPNLKNLPTLDVLEGTSKGPGALTNGPAVTNMLKIVSHNPSNEMSAKAYCENLRNVVMASRRRRSKAPSSNPMGEFGPSEAVSYYAPLESQEQLRRSLTAPSPLAVADMSSVSSQPSGIFQQTEVDVEVTMLSSSVPLLPKMPTSFLTDSSALEHETDPGGSTIVEPDDRSQRMGAPWPESSGTLAQIQRPSTSGSTRGAGASLAPATGPLRIPKKRSLAAERQTNVMKAFARAVVKKSVLVLTEQDAVRKAIGKSLLAAGVDLCFAKTSTATWKHLQDPKEAFHALIWDLSKREVTVDHLLKNIRAHERYSRLPIVVLSHDHELPETVRAACSYVVFHPIAPAMLREALLWSFDRRSLAKMASKHDGDSQKSIGNAAFSAIGASESDAFSSTLLDFVLAPGAAMDAWSASADPVAAQRKGGMGREVSFDAFVTDA
jgi:CheY-like chemotaxis protein